MGLNNSPGFGLGEKFMELTAIDNGYKSEGCHSVMSSLDSGSDSEPEDDMAKRQTLKGGRKDILESQVRNEMTMENVNPVKMSSSFNDLTGATAQKEQTVEEIKYPEIIIEKPQIANETRIGVRNCIIVI